MRQKIPTLIAAIIATAVLILQPVVGDEASDKSLAILIQKFSQIKHNVERVGINLHDLERVNESFPPEGFKSSLNSAVEKYDGVETTFNALIDRILTEVNSKTEISVEENETSLTDVQNRYKELLSAYKDVQGHSMQLGSMGDIFEGFYTMGKKLWESMSHSPDSQILDQLKQLKIVPYVALG